MADKVIDYSEELYQTSFEILYTMNKESETVNNLQFVQNIDKTVFIYLILATLLLSLIYYSFNGNKNIVNSILIGLESLITGSK